MQALLPRDEADEHSAVLEVRAGMLSVPADKREGCDRCFLCTGAGGKEAALFTAEIFDMYQRYVRQATCNFINLNIVVTTAFMPSLILF